MKSEFKTTPIEERPLQSEVVKQILKCMRQAQQERNEAMSLALPAIVRLVEACRGGGGQAYKLRSLLFSLWSGKPADLSDTLCLDWSLKKDFAAVLLAFGHNQFFYGAIETAFFEADLVRWFKEEGGAE